MAERIVITVKTRYWILYEKDTPGRSSHPHSSKYYLRCGHFLSPGAGKVYPGMGTSKINYPA